MSDGSILLTGATGFLGMEMLARLVDRGEGSIYLLVRSGPGASAQDRAERLMGTLYEEVPARARASVRVIEGDLLSPGLGLSEGDREELCANVDRIVHCAASISFGLSLEEARAVNVEGVVRLLELARQIDARRGLARLVHVSTAYVGGLREDPFPELAVEGGADFRNTYERSKCEAEGLVAAAAQELPVVIARPSIVVGQSGSGWTPAFNVIYWPIRAYERGLIEAIPADGGAIVDFVPVDYVAEATIALLGMPGARGIYHLVSGDLAVTVGEMVTLYATGFSRPPAPMRKGSGDGGMPRGAETYLPYFDVRCRFEDGRAVDALAPDLVKPDPRDYFGRLIGYAHTTAWGKRSLTRQRAMELAGDG